MSEYTALCHRFQAPIPAFLRILLALGIYFGTLVIVRRALRHGNENSRFSKCEVILFSQNPLAKLLLWKYIKVVTL